MADDIYAYKEGLTPTSFITTKNVSKGMKDNKFTYFMINKNAKINNAVQFIDELGGDIAKKLKRNIAKVVSYMSKEMEKNALKLDKIRTGVEKAQATLEEVNSVVEAVTTGREKQRLLSTIRKQAKAGFLTGKPLLEITDKLNKHIEDLPKRQRRLKESIEAFKKSEVLDAETKTKFFELFNKEFTLERFTQEKQA